MLAKSGDILGTIQRQGIINTFLIYAGVALGFINTVVIQPKFLHTNEVGLTRLMINFGALSSTFLLMGGSNTCVRFFSQFKDEKSRHHGFFGLMLLFPLAGIFLGTIAVFLLRGWIIETYSHDPADKQHLFALYFDWAYMLGAVMTLTILVNAYSGSNLRTTVPSFFNDIWVKFALIVVTIAYSLGWMQLDWYVRAVFLTYVSQLLFMLGYIFYIDKPGLKVDWKFAKEAGIWKIIRFSMLMSLASLSSLSIKFLDSVMIGAYLSLDSVAIYSIGAFIAQFIETPLASLERVAMVKIAHSFKSNNMEEIKTIYYRSVRYLFLLGGFLTVCIVTNVHDFLMLLPEDYRAASSVTIIMCAGSLVNMATGVNSPIINNSTKYYWNLVFLGFLLVTTILFNMLLIPKYGIVGSAIATGLSVAMFNIMKFFFIWKNFRMQPYDAATLKTIVVIGAALAAGLFLPVPAQPFWAIVVRGVCISLVYGVLTWTMNIIPEFHSYLPFGKRNKNR